MSELEKIAELLREFSDRVAECSETDDEADILSKIIEELIVLLMLIDIRQHSSNSTARRKLAEELIRIINKLNNLKEQLEHEIHSGN